MFRQNLLRVPVTKFNLQKSSTAHKLFYKLFLRFPVGFFFTYLLIHLFIAAVSYMAHISCIRIRPSKRYYFPILLFLRWKAKEK